MGLSDNLPPIHPGEFLKDELDALRMSARSFAKHISVPPNAVTAIINGDRGISAGMALRLGQAFGTDPRFWTNLQSYYDTKIARIELGEKIGLIERLPGVDVAA